MMAQAQFSEQDAKFMALALSLAKRGELSVSPNPSVGCVLVSDQGKLVGQGFHVRAGEPHAEVIALAQAGSHAKGATAYVTLEPCAHHGRTGPCAQALVNAGVVKVIAATLDPNPLVAGKGMAMLEQASIHTSSGLMEKHAQAINAAFFTRMLTKRPYVILKLAASLDGKTALANGESQWITSPQARRDVQLERARSCAILSGSGTVLSDNPRLNVRADELSPSNAEAFAKRGKQPLRVIVDGQNQLNHHLHLLQDGQATRVYNHRFDSSIANDFVTQVQLDRKQNGRHVDLARMLDDLGHEQINRVWVEAGAKLAGALLDADLVDELVLYMAPKLLGGNAMELVSTQTKTHLNQALNAPISELKQIGPDIKLRCQLKQRG
ncbi:bifunctional diaminohydroxyphosphoribosylaminopyrimidine deaminase/5-amino-6-(5-phosphoribosylamino)uracil reductase RibD [Glaciecola siphonariae]|uniref:Riboflavin biosynthesis protein RibD n=1 Tax=Glaciecola siphonariae TaxID=521012 RepID=A0ABV9M0C1_9ALTE